MRTGLQRKDHILFSDSYFKSLAWAQIFLFVDVKCRNTITKKSKLNITKYKKLYTITKWNLLQVCKIGPIFENQLMQPYKKNHMTISIDEIRKNLTKYSSHS